MAESYSALLRTEADTIWRKIFSNPFLTEIQNGSLPLEKFRYFLAQDYLYLDLLSRRIITPVERPLHQKLMSLVGLAVEEVERLGPSPTNLAYINHMIKTAALSGLGPTAAALLPCPWSYHEIGGFLKPVEHPVYGQWVAAYMEGFLEESTNAWRSFVDQEAAEAGPREREAMRTAFLTSSRYEYMFWKMAYEQESWPI